MKSDKKRKKNWLLYFILGGFIFKLLAFVFKKERPGIKINFKDYADEEEKEIKRLRDKKESADKFIKNSARIFKHYFIPNQNNNYKPKILHTKSLAVIIICSIMIKAGLVGYLFFNYPNQAKMSELFSEQLVTLINQDRQENGKAVLAENVVLMSAANKKARDMIKNNYFAHIDSNGKKPWDWINRGEYAYLSVGENLAMNFTSAESAHSALMQSESHKKNILNGKYSDIGLAVVEGEINGKKTNVLVELFAVKLPAKLAQISGDWEELKPEIQKKPIAKNMEITDKSEEKLSVKNLAIKPADIKNKPLVKNMELTEIPVSFSSTTVAEAKIENIADKPQLTGLPEKTIEIVSAKSDNKTTAGLIEISDNILKLLLLIVICALLSNILIKISVQHKPAIFQTLFTIILIVCLLSFKFHNLEAIYEQVILL